MPRVTVVTPNYNHARYLPKRIDSILAQTFQDIELLILDDASTDNSREIIESYSKNQRVKAIFNQLNTGSTFKQWNLGLSQAKGEYRHFSPNPTASGSKKGLDLRREGGNCPLQRLRPSVGRSKRASLTIDCPRLTPTS